MTKRSLFLALPLLAAAPLACTAILGDFEVLPAGAGDSGAPDGGGDGPATTDAPEDSNAADSGPDAAENVRISCAEVSGSKVKLATFQENVSSTGGGDGPSSVWLGAYPNQSGGTHVAVFAEDAVGSLRTFAFTAQGGGGGPTEIPSPLPGNGGGQILGVKRYAGGFAVMVSHYVPIDGGSSTPAIDIFKLADDGTWSQPTNVAPPGAIAGPNDCIQRVQATFEILDAQTDTYVVAYSSQTAIRINSSTCGNFQTHVKGLLVRGASTPPTPQDWPLPSNVSNISFLEDGIIVAGGHVFVFANPESNGTPQSGDGAFLFQADANTLAFQTHFKVPLKNPTDILQALAVKNEPAGAGASLGFFEGDLNSTSAPPFFLVGTASAATVNSVTPANALASTPLTAITDLPVDKGRAHWESYASPASRNLFAVGRAVNTGKGLTLWWFDGQGRVRAQRSPSADAGALFVPSNSSVKVNGGNVTALSAPSVAIAQLQAAWIEDNGTSGARYDLYTMQLMCTP